MPYSREQLDVRFARLEAELKRLDLSQAPEQDRWAAFEYLVHVPASYIDDKDRRWWWEQVYAMMERHGLAELSGVATGSH